MHTLSNRISNIVNVEQDTPLTYRGRQWMPALFDTPKRKRLWKMSRQVGKSTGGAAEGTTRCATIPNFKILYVAPVYDQVSKFSKDRVDAIIESSPLIQSQVGTPDNETEKKFKKGGKYYMAWAKHRPDNIRGVTADMVHYDEVQDQDLEEIEPVINEVCFTSQLYNLRLYTGTPKSLANGIEKKWQESDQREWLVRCGRHDPAKWIRLGIRNIGKRGPVCHACGNLLDVSQGQWVKHSEGKIAGFHVHQLNLKISHMIMQDGEWVPHQPSWNEIIEKLEDNPEAKFLNEVLGESADTADVTLTEAHLKSAANADVSIHKEPLAKWTDGQMFAGIDWGHGDAATALVIGRFIDGYFQVLFCKKYTGKQCDPDYAVPDIAHICKKWRVQRIHCDHGGGFAMTQDMRDIFGKKVTANIWSTSAKAADRKWKTDDVKVPRLTLNKPEAIAQVLRNIRKCDIRLPKWEEFKDGFSQDLLNVRRELVEKRNGEQRERYVKAGHDDLFHALCYAWIIGKVSQNRGL